MPLLALGLIGAIAVSPRAFKFGAALRQGATSARCDDRPQARLRRLAAWPYNVRAMSPQIRVVALMATASTIVYMDRTAITLAAPEMIHHTGISETAMGGVFSVFYLAYTLFMIPGGWLSDRFGPRSTLSAGLLAAGVLTALTAVAGLKTLISLGAAYGFLFAVRLAFGAAAAPLYPGCARLTANWFPPATTARVQAVIFGVTAIGIGLLPIPLTLFMRDLGWQSAFLILGVVTAVIAGVWHLLANDSPADAHSKFARVREKPSMSAARSVILSRNVVLLAVSYGAFSYFVYLFESWTFYYYREVRQFGSTESASYMSAMLLAGALTMPLGGWVSDRLTLRFGSSIGRPAVPIFGVIVSVALCAIGAAGLPPLATGVALALSYGFLESGEPVYWAFIIETTGKKSGTACGMLNTGSNAGGILAPIVSPWIAGIFGWNIAFYVGALIACLGILPWLFLRATPGDVRTSGPAHAMETTV